jgi:FAD-dependent urate hydroxylase
MGTCNVAVVGAGPYGLSAAAHLLNVKGLTVRVFGEPMSFWEHHMPSGMLLRSPWVASHLSDPAGMLTLDAYRKLNGNHFAAPIPLERFIDYGRWFQRRAVPDVDKRQVKRIEADSTGFQLTLEDGESLPAHRVVVATGIASFA